MHIAPEPGLLNPTTALKKLFHRKGLLSSMVLLLLCISGLQAKSLPPGIPDLTHPNTTISIQTNNSIADGLAKNKIVFHLADSDGNPVPFYSFDFVYNPGSGNVTTGGNTDAAGNASVELGSTTVGQFTVTIRVNGVVLSGPQIINFVAYVPDLTVSTTYIETTSNNAVANGTGTNCVKVHLTDALGNPVPNKNVVLSITGSATPSGAVTITTAMDGTASTCYTSLVAGDIVVSATVGGQPVKNQSGGNTLTLTFIADVPDLTNPLTTFTVTQDNALANNVQTNQVRAHIVDANNNPVKNQDVSITIVSGTVTQPTVVVVKTDNNGNAILNYTSTVANNPVVKAEIGGLAVGTQQTMHFVHDVPSNTSPQTRLVVVTNNAKADGIETNCVKATVTDNNGNVVAGQTVQFSVQYGFGTFVGGVSSGITDVNGEVSVCLHSTKSGTTGITATFGTAPPVNIINGSPVVVTFTAGAPDPSNPGNTVTVIKDNAIADNADNIRIRVHLVDGNGNPVAPGQLVNIDLVSGVGYPLPLTPLVPLININIYTDTQGDAYLNVYSTLANVIGVIAYHNGIAVNAVPRTATFVAGPPDVTHAGTFFETITNNAVADGVQTDCVVAHLKDKNGNPVTNFEVVFDKPTGTASPSAQVKILTDASGNATSCYTSTVAGDITVTATVVTGTGNQVVKNTTGGTSEKLTFVADAPDVTSPTTILTIIKDNSVANGTDKNRVNAHITDKNGNPIKNQDVVIIIVSGSVQQATTITVKTDNNGDAIAEYTSIVAGTVTVRATLNGTDINQSPRNMTFRSDNPSPGTSSSYLQYVGDNTAAADGNDANTVFAHVADVNGNPVAGVSVVFTMVGAINSTQTITTNAAGNAYLLMQSSLAGSVVITATVNGSPIVTGSPLTVLFLVGLPDNTNAKTRFEVKKGIAAADDVDRNIIVAHVHDKYDNPVPGQTVDITIATGTATAESLTGVTDAKGEVTFRLHSTVAGEVTVTALINTTIDILNGKPAKVVFVKDPDVTNPLTYIMTVIDNAIADGVVTNSVKAHIADAAGNSLEEKDVTFWISEGDASATLNVTTVTTDINGEATVLVTSKKPGNVSIMAIVNGDTIRFGSPAKVRFIAEDVYVPKVFTPNGDGTNDVLKPIIVGTFNFLYFNVYNRWGNMVFTTRDVNVGWDGRLKSVLQPNETYLWMVGGTDKEGKKMVKKGMTSLVR